MQLMYIYIYRREIYKDIYIRTNITALYISYNLNMYQLI